ncbi:MAG: family, FAD-dependent NAD(P)-disulfide oxidoreductase [Edaphobacter sp.]|jgi:hypothetical protein|nr:family, FAD-dependent NAD(P)-disulfide oxidoreductase [Edaphobacter sp.]
MENPDSLRHEDGPGQVWSAYSVHSLGFQKGINREPEGVGAGEILAAVQIAMIAGLPYTALRDAVLTHPTLVEGLIPLFSSAPSTHNVVENGGVQISAT